MQTPGMTSAPRASEALVKPPVEILYRDTHIVVVNKASGLLVHRGWAQDRVTAMSAVRDATGQHVYPLHRLDRGTSGALMFAFSPDTAAQLGEAFERGRIHKRYIALVRGRLDGTGALDYPIPGREHGAAGSGCHELPWSCAIECRSL